MDDPALDGKFPQPAVDRKRQLVHIHHHRINHQLQLQWKGVGAAAESEQISCGHGSRLQTEQSAFFTVDLVCTLNMAVRSEVEQAHMVLIDFAAADAEILLAAKFKPSGDAGLQTKPGKGQKFAIADLFHHLYRFSLKRSLSREITDIIHLLERIPLIDCRDEHHKH
ncbi:hypothetical protein D3C75_651310 [compost metagenome]